jgi:tetratricopeptide (TPR) repeat protein
MDKGIKWALGAFRELIAKIMLDDLEVQGGLLQPRKKTEPRDEGSKKGLILQLEARGKNLDKVGDLLQAEVGFLLPSEKIRIEEEMERAGEVASELIAPYEGRGSITVGPEDTFQKVLGFSNETLFWIYSVGQQFFMQEKKEEAFVLFEFLTAVNPIVCDYWIAQGLSLRGLSRVDDALYSFTMASLMEPNNPVPRYNATELYLEKNLVADAKVELDMLEEIIEMNELIELKPSLVAIKNRVELA